MAENEEDVKTSQEEDQNSIHMDKQKDKVFSTEEIKIEEMAIDGICGVY